MTEMSRIRFLLRARPFYTFVQDGLRLIAEGHLWRCIATGESAKNDLSVVAELVDGAVLAKAHHLSLQPCSIHARLMGLAWKAASCA